MAIATYGDIAAEIRSWTNRKDLTDSQVSSFIYYAGNAANQILRVPPMEHTELLEVSEGGKLIIPFDYLELKSITAHWNSETSIPLERMAWDQFINFRNSGDISGQPRYFAQQGPYIFLGPAPAVGTKVTFHYYRSMPDISPIENINWLSQMSPAAYLYGGLHFAYLFLMDEARSDYWKEKFQLEITRIQMLADRSAHMGSALTVRPKQTVRVL